MRENILRDVGMLETIRNQRESVQNNVNDQCLRGLYLSDIQHHLASSRLVIPLSAKYFEEAASNYGSAAVRKTPISALKIPEVLFCNCENIRQVSCHSI